MMDFLTDHLTNWLVDAPDNTVLASRPSFDFREPIWWLAAVLIPIITIGVVLFYCLERGTVGWIRRMFLIPIRIGLLILVLLLTFRPVLVAEFKGERTRQIVVLVDSSQSMSLQDRRVSPEDILRVAIAKGYVPLDTKVDDSEKSKDLVKELRSTTDLPKDPPRIEIVRSVLSHKELKSQKELKLIDSLAKKGPLQTWEFGSRLMGLKQEADPVPESALTKLAALKDKEFDNDKVFDGALRKALGDEDFKSHRDRIARSAGKNYKLTQESFSTLASKDRKDVNELLLANLRAVDNKTHLYDAVSDILQRKGENHPAAIFIITDGQDNGSKLTRPDIAKLCRTYDVPLFIYGVGSAQSASLQFKEVIVPDTLFVKDTAEIKAIWKLKGITKGTVEIDLQMARKKPDTNEWDKYEPVKDKEGKDLIKKIKVKEGLDLRETLIFPVLEPPGLKPNEDVDEIQRLKVTLRLADNDDFKDVFNEFVEREVRVTNRKIKVLVIEGAPRHEFKFLQGALDPDRERRFETSYFLASADEQVTRPNIKATPEEIRKKPFIRSLPKTREEFFDAKFDVIVLGDISPEALGAERLVWIKEFVEKFQGGLIVVAGRQHMPIKYREISKDDKKENLNLLAKLLPVEFDNKLGLEDRPQEYRPTLTDVGQRTDMLYLAETPEESLKVWQELLPAGFYWQFPVTGMRAGASALVVNPRVKMKENQSMPVIVTHMIGNGQVLFCGTDETWRWRKDVGDKYYVRYWGQLLYQMGLPHLLGDNGKRVTFTQNQAEMTQDKQSYFYVRALKKDYTARDDVEIEATLEKIDEKGPRAETPLKLTRVPGLDGKPVDGYYRVLLMNKEGGKFRVSLKNLEEPYSFTYRVDAPPKHELDELGLADKELRDLAKDSGGKFYREEDLRRLADDVKERKVDFHIRQELVLWNPLVMLLFIALITAEWLIRKFSNLA
jgi:hypothetical protein